MALARSLSGPAGLSINTTSANSSLGSSNTTPAAGGMFGSTGASKPGGLFGLTTTSAPQSGGLFGGATSQPQSGGLFGTTATTSQPQTGGLFGTATASSQPQTGGLFGTATASTQPQTGGLFGTANAPATSQPATGSLFGAAAAKPQTGGLFGGASAATSQPQTGGLFGASTATTSQPQSGGLFGGTAATSQAQTGGGLFGGLNSQSQNKPATSLFGGLGNNQTQQNQPQAQQNSMFSQSQQQNAGGLGGGLSLGQGNAQNQQSVPGVRIDLTNLRGTTRFNDLYDDLQQTIMKMDEVIQGQIKLKNDCDAIMPAHDQQLSQVPGDVAFCSRKLMGVEGALVSDVKSIAVARDLVKVDAENAKLSFKAIDNLKLPPQYHNTGIWSTKSSDNQSGNGEEEQDIVGLFSATTDELSSTLKRYQMNINEIEQHLRNVEGASAQQINAFIAKRSGSSSAHEDPVAELAAALREFEQSILGVAGKVGGARESVQNLQLGGLAARSSGNNVNGKRSGIY